MSENKIITGALPKGTVIKSTRYSYRVEKVLGAGGFGITYKVTRVSDGMVFALKEYFPSTLCERGEVDKVTYLKTNALKFEEGVRDFITEAKRLDKQNIAHPNIISVEEVFKANDTAYYTMEFVDGVNLRQYIKKQHNRPLTLEQTLSVMRPILQAVALIHKNRLTHYDIKHDNILLTEEEDGSLRPVLIDFGQAKHYDKKGDATSTLTNAGCSDGFSPQEQYAGLPKFTPQADVYAICATIIYLLTAKVPPKASDISTLVILSLLGESIPQQIKDALVNGLRKDKDDRTQTVVKLAEDLGLDISSDIDGGSVTRLLSVHRRHKFDWSKYKKSFINAGIAVVALGVITGGIVLYGKLKPTDSEILTNAIDNSDFKILRKYAMLDSVRAYYPFAFVLLHQKKDYYQAEQFASKALKTVINRKDSIQIQTLFSDIEKARRRAEYRASGVPNDISDYVIDGAIEYQEQLVSDVIDKTNLDKAIINRDLEMLVSLASKGYDGAYYPLAQLYYEDGLKEKAMFWANKAIRANVDKQNANKLIYKINHTQKQEDNRTEIQNTPNDDELFAKATTINDLKALADKGYAKAYAPLAEKYLADKKYSEADRYARRAISSGKGLNQAKSVVSKLDVIGFYDNGENGGKPQI